jgi:hypothetical protein
VGLEGVEAVGAVVEIVAGLALEARPRQWRHLTPTARDVCVA